MAKTTTTTIYTKVFFRDKPGQLRLSSEKITFKPEKSDQGKKDSWRWPAVRKHLVSARTNEKALLKLVSQDDPTKSLVFALRNHDELETICNDVTERLRLSRKLELSDTSESSLNLDEIGEFNMSMSRPQRALGRLASDMSFASVHIPDDSLPNMDDSAVSRSSLRSPNGGARRRRNSAKKSSSKARKNSYMSAIGLKKGRTKSDTSSFLRLIMVLGVGSILVLGSGLMATRAGYLNGVVDRSPFLQEMAFPDKVAAMKKQRKRGLFQQKGVEESMEEKYCLWTKPDSTGKGGDDECVLPLPFVAKQ